MLRAKEMLDGWLTTIATVWINTVKQN